MTNEQISISISLLRSKIYDITRIHVYGHTHTYTGGKKRYCVKHWEERKNYLKSISSSKGTKPKGPTKRKRSSSSSEKPIADSAPPLQTKFKVDEIVHALWDQYDKQRYAAQVLSVQDKSYNLFFLNGTTRNDVHVLTLSHSPLFTTHSFIHSGARTSHQAIDQERP